MYNLYESSPRVQTCGKRSPRQVVLRDRDLILAPGSGLARH